MAIILMLLSSASFATMSAFVKAIGAQVPLSHLIFLRCLLPLPLLALWLLRHRKPLIVKAKGTLFFRSLFGFLAMAGFYYALTHMPLAQCIFIGRAQPLILALIAPFIVRERAPMSAWVAIFTGMTGVFLIMRPDDRIMTPAWIALAAAGSAALAHLLVRRLNRTDEPLVIVFDFFAITACLSGLWSVFNFVLPASHLWLPILAVAFFATLGQFLMTLAYRYDMAPVVAAASYSSVVLSVVYGYVFWDEVPGAMVLSGALLVISGGLYLFFMRQKQLRSSRSDSGHHLH